jgi:riboflavin biosynthesis pyrimidine reductase
MKPHVICHMVASIDGRILGSRWRPKGFDSGTLFERLHDELGCDAWIIGRVTGSEFAKGKNYPKVDKPPLPRENFYARRDAPTYGVALDAHGKIAWGRADIGGDPIVAVLTQGVSDDHLYGLRADGVSYIFAGEQELDLPAVLETLNRDLDVKRVLVEGGGTANGAFLRAGLIDELSIVICPAVDGGQGAPSIFHSHDADADTPAAVETLKLASTKVLDGGAVWLRYNLT